MKPILTCSSLFIVSALSVSFISAESPRGPVIAPLLQPLVDHHTLAGAVTLVANKDTTLAIEAVGFADVAAQKAMRTDALFWIASMSKPITATAFMILVDEGKVSLDDPVEKYLPEFKGQMVTTDPAKPDAPLAKPVHPITLRNILSHTSGLAFSSPLETPTLDILPLEDRVRSYAKMPLRFQPDSQYQYANAGINTVGRIIEVLSGMKYENYLQKRLFYPLGMKDTTFSPNVEQIARLAKSYRSNKDNTDLEETNISQLKYPLNDPSRQPMPAGGLFSTASDTANFCQMLLHGGTFHGRRILSESAVKQLTSRQTPVALPQCYGLGFSIEGSTYGHGGAYGTNMNVDPARGLITIFMVQNAGWRDEGRQALPIFTKASIEAYGGKQP